MYHEIIFFTDQNVHDVYNTKSCLTTESYCHRLLLSVLQICIVDVHVCVYSSYKESVSIVNCIGKVFPSISAAKFCTRSEYRSASRALFKDLYFVILPDMAEYLRWCNDSLSGSQFDQYIQGEHFRLKNCCCCRCCSCCYSCKNMFYRFCIGRRCSCLHHCWSIIYGTVYNLWRIRSWKNNVIQSTHAQCCPYYKQRELVCFIWLLLNHFNSLKMRLRETCDWTWSPFRLNVCLFWLKCVLVNSDIDRYN